MKRTGLLGWVVLLGVVLSCAADAWAARPATVRGPERAFIRRGPGTEFQAFATVENGEQVEVEEVTGTWALVRTAAGESGYVHAAFLVYAGNSPVAASITPTAPAAAAPAAAVETPAGRADAAAAPAAAGAPAGLEERNATLTAEVEALQREVESLRRGPGAVASPGEDIVSLRAEVRRLADVTDALRDRLDAPTAGGFAVGGGADGHWATSTVVVLAGCALLLGWVLGGVLARREERGRRNRIRF